MWFCIRPLEDSTMEDSDKRVQQLDANKVVMGVVVTLALGILIQVLLLYLFS